MHFSQAAARGMLVMIGCHRVRADAWEGSRSARGADLHAKLSARTRKGPEEILADHERRQAAAAELRVAREAKERERLEKERLRDEHAPAVAHVLQTNKELQELGLARNQLTGQGAVTIAHALHHAASLRVLWLSGNRLGDEGGSATTGWRIGSKGELGRTATGVTQGVACCCCC